MPFKKGNRLGARRRRTNDVTRTPTPVLTSDLADEDMLDGDADAEETRNATPADDEEDEIAPDDDDEGEPEDDDEPVITSIPRRRGRVRGRGGPRSSARVEFTPELGDDASESGTPARRRGRRPGPASRGGRGGFRGRRKGQEPAPHVRDEVGNIHDVQGDEADVDQDDEGDEKVDELGNLLGGREYRVRTFTILGRGERLYMLSTEPARCCGFRDSYLFFTKHPKLFKVLLGPTEKEDLIAREILPNSYKGRNIGVVTARSVFREFGARIIVGGKRVVDDYQATEARENGEIEGELADPDDRLPGKGEEYNRNRYVAWFGASEVYRQPGGGGTSAIQNKAGPIGGRRKNNITVENWQTMHSREASRFNSSLTYLRRANVDGVYETHTNMMFYPKITQPTHAYWEPAGSKMQKDRPQLTNGDATTNGDTNFPHHQTMDIDSSHPTNFNAVPTLISRNFAVVDTHFTSPPISNTGYPGPDGIATDPTSGPNGLDSIPDDVAAELPDECRAAFEEARRMERSWKSKWGTEAQSGGRKDLKIGFSGYPV